MKNLLKGEKLEGIFSRLEDKEGSDIEYKLSNSRLSKDLWETVSAFSNEGGGFILLGYEKKEISMCRWA